MSDLFKGGWHPGGEKGISRATWKKDMKSLVSRKDEDATRAKDHVATPLGTLKDPDSFGPPPKHTAYYPNAQSPRAATPKTTAVATTSTSSGFGPPVASRNSPATGLGAPVPVTKREVAHSEEEEERPAPGPFRANTTGLQTDNLPKPPGRNGGEQTSASANTAVSRPVPSLPSRSATRPVPALPSPIAAGSRPVPAVPPRQAGPPPGLPPRQNETPTEYTPPAPPSYGEATRTPQAAALNTSALNRLGQAGVSVPGFGIGSSPQSPAGHSGQMGELQQRFARMNDNGSTASASPTAALPTWKQAQALHSAAAANPAIVGGIQSAVNNSTTGSPSSATTPLWKQAQALHGASTAHPEAVAGVQSAFNAASQKKKPPPPAKKAGLSDTHVTSNTLTAPPIPTLSKPRQD